MCIFVSIAEGGGKCREAKVEGNRQDIGSEFPLPPSAIATLEETPNGGSEESRGGNPSHPGLEQNISHSVNQERTL